MNVWLFSGFLKNWLRWLLGLRKLRSSEKIEILQIGFILQVAWWENIIFYYGWKHSVFSLFLPWNYFLQLWAIWLQSTLTFTWTFCIFKHKHKSNIKGAIFELRSSHLFQDQLYKEVLQKQSPACVLWKSYS